MRAAGDLLARALEKRGACRILAQRDVPWASVTFVGARHEVRVLVENAVFLDGIEEAEVSLGEYLLADIVVVSRALVGEAWVVELEALTIEDWRPSAIASVGPGVLGCGEFPPRSAPAFAGEVKGGYAGGVDAGCVRTEIAAQDGRPEAFDPITCGTKGAFVPLAGA